jgi:hypothetical protein
MKDTIVCHLDTVTLKLINDEETPVTGKIFINGESVYLLHNNSDYDGNYPIGVENYDMHGEYSWYLCDRHLEDTVDGRPIADLTDMTARDWIFDCLNCRADSQHTPPENATPLLTPMREKLRKLAELQVKINEHEKLLTALRAEQDKLLIS